MGVDFAERVDRVKVARTPYMKVTLCRKEVAGMNDSGAT